jgi:hypothetical protein
MPKNTKGGKGHKKGARKNVVPFNKNKFRTAKEEGEIYARVLSVFGNGMAEVLCNDDVKRLLIIRRRFKGRNKRDNNVAVDTMLLVGRRNWEVIAAKKKQKVDLLYVYSKSDIDYLKKLDDINVKILPAFVNIDKDEDNPFEIDRNYTPNYDETENKNLVESVEIKPNSNNLDFDDLDFEDI